MNNFNLSVAKAGSNKSSSSSFLKSKTFSIQLLSDFRANMFLQGALEKAVVRKTKEIQIILRLFLIIAMQACRYALSSQCEPEQLISQSPTLLAGWEGSLGTCSRYQVAIHQKQPTLDSGINIGVTLINFQIFFRGYVLF